MSNLETLEARVEAHSEPANVITLPISRREEQSERESGVFRNLVKRFVAWIDGIDVDGQQYWN